MKGGTSIILFIFIILNLSSISALARMNEIELNPAGDDNKNEWIELYSDSESDLSGWKITNAKGSEFLLNFSIERHYVLYTPYRFLSNEKQKLTLFNRDGESIQESDEITDSANDERTWQYCGGRWEFLGGSKGEKNACESEEEKVISEDKNEAPESSSDEEKEPETIDESSDETELIETNENRQNEANPLLAQDVIKLEPKGIKSEKVWKSRTGQIKEYSLAGFALLCAVVLAVLWRMMKNGKDTINNDF